MVFPRGLRKKAKKGHDHTYHRTMVDITDISDAPVNEECKFTTTWGTLDNEVLVEADLATKQQNQGELH